MEQVFWQIKDKGQSGDGTLEGELVAARENGNLKMERQIQKMMCTSCLPQTRPFLFSIKVLLTGMLWKKEICRRHNSTISCHLQPHQEGDPSLHSSMDDPDFVAAITQDSDGPKDDDEGDSNWDAGDEDDSGERGVVWRS